MTILVFGINIVIRLAVIGPKKFRSYRTPNPGRAKLVPSLHGCQAPHRQYTPITMFCSSVAFSIAQYKVCTALCQAYFQLLLQSTKPHV